VMARRSFDEIVKEEESIQSASLDMEGGQMPTCLALFDRFLLCYSIPSQFKAMYRQGQIADCNDKFQDFKYCMSIRSSASSTELKREAWVKRRAEWWASRRLAPSCEDVFDGVKQYPADTKDKLDFLRKKD